MKISNINVPKPKFSLGEKVCVYSKSGIIESEINEVIISINDSGSMIYYYVGYDRYTESQVFLKKDVKTKVIENFQQLKIFELPQNQ